MHLAHPGLKDPDCYVPGLPTDWVATRYGIAPEQIAKLGSAENPLGTSPKAVAAVRDAADRLHLYPSWTGEPLREALAATYGMEPEQFMLGAGETEIIACIIRAFAEVGGKVQMPRPCFPIYLRAQTGGAHLFAEAEGRRPVMVDTTDMALDVDRYVAAIEHDTRIVFVTKPHSPSGTWLTEAAVRRIVDGAPHALVVLDEAYIHYAQSRGFLHLVAEYDNLAVLRTFSKAFGLAGLRIGFGLAAGPSSTRCWRSNPRGTPARRRSPAGSPAGRRPARPAHRRHDRRQPVVRDAADARPRPLPRGAGVARQLLNEAPCTIPSPATRCETRWAASPATASPATACFHAGGSGRRAGSAALWTALCPSGTAAAVTPAGAHGAGR